jgi:hypothetical protein
MKTPPPPLGGRQPAGLNQLPTTMIGVFVMGRLWVCPLDDYHVLEEDAPNVARIVRALGEEVYVGFHNGGRVSLAIIRPASGGETDRYLSLEDAKKLVRALKFAIGVAESAAPPRMKSDVQEVDALSPEDNEPPLEPKIEPAPDIDF